MKVERMLFKIGSVWRGMRPVVMVCAWTWWSWVMDLHCLIKCKVLIEQLMGTCACNSFHFHEEVLRV